jgi:hypothetical protein
MMQHQVSQPDGSTVQVSRPHEFIKQSVTRVQMRPDYDDPDEVAHALSTDNDRMLLMVARVVGDADQKYAMGVYEMEQIVSIHTGGAKPTWVRSNDPEFARVLGAYYKCPVGEPVMLLTNVGRDALHHQNLDTATQPAAFNYGALTANNGSGFAAGDTTLAGEITTASGGLVRAQMTFAHTSSTNTSTLTKTWTANGSDSLPVTIASWGVFNASSVGTLGYEDALNATATLNVSGDSVTVTFTLTAG